MMILTVCDKCGAQCEIELCECCSGNLELNLPWKECICGGTGFIMGIEEEDNLEEL